MSKNESEFQDRYCENCDQWYSGLDWGCGFCSYPLQTEAEINHEGMVQLDDGTWVPEEAAND